MPLACRSRSGFILAVVLFLSLIMTILGMAFIGSRATLYRGSVRLGDLAQAKAFAEAGLEDARVKLDKDLRFPPSSPDEQDIFGYSEDMTDLAGNVLGSYDVTIDSTYAVAPYHFLRITSVGRLGPREGPTAQHTVSAELDLAAIERNPPAAPAIPAENPRHFHFQRWNSSQNR